MDELPLTPTPEPQSPTGVYIPSDLPDCFSELDKMLSVSLREDIRAGSETDLAQHHFGLGLWLRNHWGLWSVKSRLKLYFARFGIQDADTISNLILTSYWHYLNGRPVEVSRQIVYDKIMRAEIKHGPKPSN